MNLNHNQSSVQNMNKNSQRLAIAKMDGWEIDESPSKYEKTTARYHLYQKGHNEGLAWCSSDCLQNLIDCLPDYLNDLNIWHRLENTYKWKKAKVGSRTERSMYADQLDAIVRDRPIWNATAAQKSEAFLRTFGKWGHCEGNFRTTVHQLR